jgi:4-hydroxy-tetrahydrodipicolinate synthase
MMDFRGIHTALITPFKNGGIDYKALEKILDQQIAAKVKSIVPSGSTGEGYLISAQEREELFAFCKEYTKGAVKIVASVGTNNTKESIINAQIAEKIGVDALMIVAPYYNKPPQEGIYNHFKEIHDAISLPIMVYNIPGRSIIDISDETLAKLAKLERVVALKDATGNLSRPLTLRNIHNSNLVMLGGDDITSLAFYANGGMGVVSVISNILPAQFVAIYDAWFSGNVAQAQKMHDKLIPLLVALNIETNPIAIKYAASLFNLCSDEVRLPLVTMSSDKKNIIKTQVDRLK